MSEPQEMTDAQISKAYNQGAKVSDLMKRTGKSYDQIQTALQNTNTRVVVGGYREGHRRAS